MIEREDAVLTLACRGDRVALGVLWASHQPSLLRFLRGMGCGSADDVASNVWLDVSRGLVRFTGDATDFKRWLYTIARRRSIDDLRRTSRRPLQLAAEAVAEQATDDSADVYERAQSLDRAIAVVRTLPRDAAEVVLLRVVADLDVAHVATLLGKSEANVRVIMHRALKRLAEQLAVTNSVVPTMNPVP